MSVQQLKKDLERAKKRNDTELIDKLEEKINLIETQQESKSQETQQESKSQETQQESKSQETQQESKNQETQQVDELKEFFVGIASMPDNQWCEERLGSFAYTSLKISIYAPKPELFDGKVGYLNIKGLPLKGTKSQNFSFYSLEQLEALISFLTNERTKSAVKFLEEHNSKYLNKTKASSKTTSNKFIFKK